MKALSDYCWETVVKKFLIFEKWYCYKNDIEENDTHQGLL